MKIKPEKHLFCFLGMILFMLCGFSRQSMAGEAKDVIIFSTFEELYGFCTRDAASADGPFLCDEADLTVSSDLEIPSGMSVTFQSFTVPEGITLTIMEDAEVMTCACTIQGELINRGTVFQGDLTEGKEDTDINAIALVPGHITNKGEMTLTDVYGKRNILWIGSQFIMRETENYGKQLDMDAGEPETQPTTSSRMETGPGPASSRKGRGRILKIFDVLEVYLPILAFFLVIVLFLRVLRTAFSEKKQVKKQHDPYVDEPFQRDRRNRISQLDAWLKDGLIEKKEYEELKKRYEKR